MRSLLGSITSDSENEGSLSRQLYEEAEPERKSNAVTPERRASSYSLRPLQKYDYMNQVIGFRIFSLQCDAPLLRIKPCIAFFNIELLTYMFLAITSFMIALGVQSVKQKKVVFITHKLPKQFLHHVFLIFVLLSAIAIIGKQFLIYTEWPF